MNFAIRLLGSKTKKQSSFRFFSKRDASRLTLLALTQTSRKENERVIENKLWLTPAEASPFIGDSPDAIYRDIRQGQFPFEFVRIGKRIKISARSLGLIPPIEGATNPQHEPQVAGAAAQK
jgi:hypothetical protein